MSLVPLENIDQAAVLKTLNLNPHDPHTHAALLICRRYGLDPLLKHVVLIQGRPYITRDGYLSFAHESGQFDGIEIVDEGEDAECWWAKAAVYRKDMSRPFTYRGRYPKKGAGNPKYGPEMAIKTAEVMSLRRAFNVTGLPAADEQWETPDPSAPTLSGAAAKTRLVALAAGDKEAAAEAWKKAGLADQRMVSEADLAAAEDELRALGWAWSPASDDYEAPTDGDDPEDDPEPPSGPGGSGHGSGDAADGDAVDTDTPVPHSAGGADMDTSPEPSNSAPVAEAGSRAEGSPAATGRPAITVKQIAQKAGLAFKNDYDAAPKGSKTRVVARLRHALAWAVTHGRASSLNDLSGEELLRMWQRVDDIIEGRLTYDADVFDDNAGVTWTMASGKTVTVLWTDSETTPDGEGEAA